MPSAKTVVGNATVLMAADVAGRALSFLLIVVIARYLGDAGLGKYSFAVSLVGLFALSADLGVMNFAVREISRDKARTRELAGNVLSIKLALAALSVALPLILVIAMGEEPDVVRAVLIFSAATFFMNLSGVADILFNAYEKLGYVALRNFVERAITVSLAVYWLATGNGLEGLMLAFLVSYLATFLLSYFLAARNIHFVTPKLDTRLWPGILKESLPFWFTGVFIAIYFRIDTVMLGMMASYEEVGWYNAAYKALDALYFIPGAVIAAAYPAMSQLYQTDRKMLQLLYRKAFYYLFALALPIGIGTTLLASRIIPFVYGAGFGSSVMALQILIWAEVIIFVSYITGYLLNSINRQLDFTKTAFAGALLNIALNLAMIPRWGYMGAAIATVLTELAVMGALLLLAHRSGYFPEVRGLARPVAAGIAMAAVLLALPQLHLLLLLPAAAATYFLALLALKGIDKDEIRIVRQLIGK